MTVMILHLLEAPPTSFEQMKDLIRHHIHAAIQTPGFLNAAMSVGAPETSEVCIVSHWRSMDDYERFIAHRVRHNSLLELVEFLTGMPVVTVFTVTDVVNGQPINTMSRKIDEDDEMPMEAFSAY